MNLLIHSMAEFESLILPVLDLVKPRHLVEIGSEHGGLTALLSRWAVASDARLTSVDPAPSPIFREWAATAQAFTHIEKPSLEAIGDLSDVDCWFIDGDHNWYTVYHELELIAQQNARSAKPALIFLHDVGWPNARRDAYYCPERIPAEYRHEYSYDIGVTIDQGDLASGGWRGHGAFAWATHEHGPRNGVLTAIEDFAGARGDEYALAVIPAVFGMAVLFSTDAPWGVELSQQLLPYHEHPLMAKLEENRLRNYLRVIEMQDAINAHRCNLGS